MHTIKAVMVATRRLTLTGMRRRVAYARDYGDHIMGKFKFPTAYTILFVLIALVAAMTGLYLRENIRW